MPLSGLTRPLAALLRSRCGGPPGLFRTAALSATSAASCLTTAAAARPLAAVTVPVGTPPPSVAAAPPVSPAGAPGPIHDASNLMAVKTGRSADGSDMTAAVSTPPVRLSASAAARLRDLASRAGDDSDGAARFPTLRLSVDGGGCAGLVYNFSLEGVDGGAGRDGEATETRGVDVDDEDVEDIVIVAENGATLVVDALSLPYVRGAVVDWEENLVRQAFCVRNNDNAEAGCGCGVSFAAKE